MSVNTIVYTRPGCMRCNVTQKKLAAGGVVVEPRQVDDHPEVKEYLQERQKLELPYVTLTYEGLEHEWFGMSKEDIDAAVYLAQLNRPVYVSS